MEINQISSEKSKHVVCIGISVVVFILGILVGALVFKGSMKTSEGIKTDNTFQAGWDAAKKRLSESERFGSMAVGPTDVRSLSGVVQLVEGNKISIKISPLEPLADPNLDIRIVVAASTTITRNVPRDAATVQKEMDAFLKSMEKPLLPGKEKPQPPVSTIKEIGKVSDIKVGDTLVVIAGENIKESKEFNVISIDIQ